MAGRPKPFGHQRFPANGWSIYGAQRAQPVATGVKRDGPENRSNKPIRSRWQPTATVSQRMVRRGSTVRVRQRASVKRLLMRVFCRLDRQRQSSDGYQNGYASSSGGARNGPFSHPSRDRAASQGLPSRARRSGPHLRPARNVATRARVFRDHSRRDNVDRAAARWPRRPRASRRPR
jgi:hypothetical protein